MTTALLIVDMQNSFVQPESPFCIRGALASVPHIARLLQGARERRWFIVHVIRQHRADGSDVERTRRQSFLDNGGYAISGSTGAAIIAELSPHADEAVVVKLRFSAFFQTNLDALLRPQLHPSHSFRRTFARLLRHSCPGCHLCTVRCHRRCKRS